MGQLHRHGREKYHSGYASRLFRVSVAHLPLQGRSVKFGRICSGARQPALAGCPLPRPASTVPGHMGELGRRFPISPLLLLAFFESGGKKISAFGTVALKAVALKEHASIGIAGRNRRAGLPLLSRICRKSPLLFTRLPFLHLNQGTAYGKCAK